MKKKMLFLLAGVLVIIIAGCNQPKKEKQEGLTVLSKNIEYDVTINNFIYNRDDGLVENAELWYGNNLESSVRLAYVDMLFKKALSGKLELTDVNGKAMDTIQLKGLLTIIDTVHLWKNNDPKQGKDTIIFNTIKPAEITALRFRENWSYDPKTMAITKEVVAVAPIKTEISRNKDFVEEYRNKRLLFWVKPTKEAGYSKLLTKRIVYGVDFYGLRNFSFILNADTVAFKNYWNLLYKAIDSGKIIAYNYGCEDLPNVQVSVKDWEKNQKHFDANSNAKLAGFKFVEEWSFDEQSMLITKKVVGLAPEHRVLDANGELKGYAMGMWVYFSDVWMPFDGKLEFKNLKK